MTTHETIVPSFERNGCPPHTTEAPCLVCGTQLFEITGVGVSREPGSQYPVMFFCETAQGLEITAGRDDRGVPHLLVDGRKERTDDVAEYFVATMERDDLARRAAEPMTTALEHTCGCVVIGDETELEHHVQSGHPITVTEDETLDAVLLRVGLFHHARTSGNQQGRIITNGERVVFEGTAGETWAWLRETNRILCAVSEHEVE